MTRLRRTLSVLAVIVATWAITTSAAALPSIPNGVFVQESTGWMWLVLDGKRIIIPVWSATDEEIRALPIAHEWAVMNESGAIVAGDMPAWLPPQGDALLSGQMTPEMRATSATGATVTPTQTAMPDDWEVLTTVAGQAAVSRYGGSEPLRATVREMTVMQTLPAVSGQMDSFETRTAVGKFVIVLVDVENIGTKPEGVVLGHTLKDSRGRVFNGDTNYHDAKVKHAILAVYPIEVRSDDFQPNLPVPRVFVYDVPADAHGFVLTAER